MRREEKYPNTSTFKFHNENPFNKYTTDCVVRAIALATGEQWGYTMSMLVNTSFKTGLMFNDKLCYGKYLESEGWIKQKQPRKIDNTKYTGVEFCEQLSNGRKIIAHIGGTHIVAIIGDKVYDTWDSTDGTIGNYWVKGE